MTAFIGRREFITLVGGAAAWPLAARAQQDRESAGQMPRVGWLWSGRSAGSPSELAGFQQGLRELGYVEGKNIVVEYRFGENSTERLYDLASDLAGLKLNLILALGTPSAKAAQQAAPTRPDHIHVRRSAQRRARDQFGPSERQPHRIVSDDAEREMAGPGARASASC